MRRVGLHSAFTVLPALALAARSWMPTAARGAFDLVAGDTYTISFGYILQGFAAGTTPTSDFTVGLGTFSNMLTAIPTVQDGLLSFVAGSNQTGVSLAFATDTAPDSFHGAVLDHIVLTHTPGVGPAVPEPSSLALFGTALVALGLRWRRKLS